MNLLLLRFVSSHASPMIFLEFDSRAGHRNEMGHGGCNNSAEATRVHSHFSALRVDEIHQIEIITRCVGCNWPSFHFGGYQSIELQTL